MSVSICQNGYIQREDMQSCAAPGQLEALDCRNIAARLKPNRDPETVAGYR